MNQTHDRLRAQVGSPTAHNEAAVWCDNAAAWADATLARFPAYLDLLQPVALALLEVRAGLGLRLAAGDMEGGGAEGGCSEAGPEAGPEAAHLLATGVVTLLSFPRPLHTPEEVGGARWQALQASLAAAAADGQSGGAGSRAQVASYTARVEGLRDMLASMVRMAQISDPHGHAAVTADPLLFSFLRLWEELKAEEAARAEEEASLFKTKTRDNNILTETVRVTVPPRPVKTVAWM